MAGEGESSAADFAGLAETFLRALDRSGVGMSITAHVDGELERLYTNAAGARLLGYSVEEVGQIPPMMPVSERDRPRLLELYRRWASGEEVPELIETELTRRDGTTIPVEVGLASADYQGAPATVAFLRDISERARALEARSRLESELIQADRLATAGTLAAGVAHEINNPLTYLLLNLDRIERTLRERGLLDRRLASLLAAAHDGGERVRVVVRDLHAFSTPGPDDDGPADLADVVRVSIALADHALRHGARLETALEPVPPVAASPARVGQVLLNLLVNAAQAFEREAPGDNLVRVTARERDGAVVLIVEDNGTGIAPDDLERVFRPFFTTKPPGIGTGLGLSITRSICESLGGDVSIESELGRGTRVIVTLPIAGPAEEPAIEAARPPPDRRRIVVVDDEPFVAEALRNTLAADHEVVAHTEAAAALEALGAGPTPDLVLCDLRMPGLSGHELYERAVALDPALATRFLFVTGVEPSRAEAFLASIGCPVLRKPFDVTQLDAAVARALVEATR